MRLLRTLSARKHSDDVIAAALMNSTIGPGKPLAAHLVTVGSHFLQQAKSKRRGC
jgi:hypothetical protein